MSEHLGANVYVTTNDRRQTKPPVYVMKDDSGEMLEETFYV